MRRLSELSVPSVPVYLSFVNASCPSTPSENSSILVQHGKEPNGRGRSCRQEALSVVSLHLYSLCDRLTCLGTLWTFWWNRFYTRSTCQRARTYLARCVLVGNSSPFGLLRGATFAFTTFQMFMINSDDILGARLLLLDFSRGIYIWSNEINICLWGHFRGGVFHPTVSNACGVLGGFAIRAIFMLWGRWNSWVEKSLTMI